MEDNQSLARIICIEGEIENTSPVLIASGFSNDYDKEFVKRLNDKPYLPGSSIAGKLKREISKTTNKEFQSSYSWQTFWGGADSQSHIIIEDAEIINDDFSMSYRDGVKIDNKSNVAEDKGKFNYEILEPGAKFKIRFEIKIRKSFDQKEYLNIIGEINSYFNNEPQFGSSYKTGFGIFKTNKLDIFDFDFQKNPMAADQWFSYLTNKTDVEYSKLALNVSNKVKNKVFTMSANFDIVSTLLTATNPENSEDPDKVQLRYKSGQLVLSGASVRGALRHRAMRILKTQACNNAEDQINNLFGYVDKDSRSAQKSRLRVKEFVFGKNPNQTFNQTRIKIDRFTGGTISTALLDSQPVQKQAVSLYLDVVNYKPEDINLMFLTLKDLWNQDLAIGGEKNIGRGILKGKSAEITIGTDQIHISENGISKVDFEKLKKHLPYGNS
jgi:CRISPR/Cas system CSM-associated protein Csm3 (group 7 of RAMP superfamily)